MRYSLGLIMLFVWVGSANALTPLPDNSPSFFAGEWIGTGEQGTYCYLKLSADGRGQVLIDGGTGDWLGARIQWRNRKQTVQVEKIIPLVDAIQRRIIPLTQFILAGGVNQSLRLTWNVQSSGCHLQKIQSIANHLKRARSATAGLPQAGDK